jgi:hypothetical protein
MQLSLLSIRIRIIIMDINYGYYPLSVYEIMTILGFGIIIYTYSKYKNALFIVKHYYSYQTY